MPRAMWLQKENLGNCQQLLPGDFSCYSENRVVQLTGRLNPSVTLDLTNPTICHLTYAGEQDIKMNNVQVVWKPHGDIAGSNGTWLEIGNGEITTKLLVVSDAVLLQTGVKEVTFNPDNNFSLVLRRLKTGVVSEKTHKSGRWKIDFKNKQDRVWSMYSKVTIFTIGDGKVVRSGGQALRTSFSLLSITALLSHINERQCKLSVFVNDDDVQTILTKPFRFFAEGVCNETYRKLLLLSNFNISSCIIPQLSTPEEQGNITIFMTFQVFPKKGSDNRVYKRGTAFEVGVDNSTKWTLSPNTVYLKHRHVSVYELM
eukprot:GHVS01084059.1.p1 GENE.GHVS01084059.1~~GHVS01084059.1.p1  ORF type:complete len:314 (-),score=15.35 GHVS01084059.1:91-1032(-)